MAGYVFPAVLFVTAAFVCFAVPPIVVSSFTLDLKRTVRGCAVAGVLTAVVGHALFSSSSLQVAAWGACAGAAGLLLQMAWIKWDVDLTI